MSPASVERLPLNPIITPAMLPPGDGDNINGPTLMRVPDWTPNPLGRYYLYFAHHNGTYIRLVYADAPEGPYRIHAGGVLPLEAAPILCQHVASPEVVVDEANRVIRLYVHGPAQAEAYQRSPLENCGQNKHPQVSILATSRDGLHFEAQSELLAHSYMRLFPWDGGWYALAWGGKLWASPAYDKTFTLVSEPFADLMDKMGRAKGLQDYFRVRHVALDWPDPQKPDQLDIYYTCAGDRPEQIYRSRMVLDGAPRTWRPGPAEPILAPETDWEGADLPSTPSGNGPAHGRERALRDPFLYREGEKAYLLYSIAGESGLAIARLNDS